MEPVSYRIEDGIALVEINNPPVNALSVPVHRALLAIIDDLDRNPNVLCIVLYGRRTFIAGADIKELKMQIVLHQPVTDVIESCSKPVIAAISGFALGGGFEVAISCHYRIATSNTIFGFPEVGLGILPAMSGTQRFPRLVGLEVAFDLIPTGRRINAKEALSVGAIDKICHGDLLKEAIDYAKSIANQPIENRRTSQMEVKFAENAQKLHDAALLKVQKRFRGYISPLFCIKSVMAAVQYPFKEGLQKEQEYLKMLRSSGQAQALMYAFFAERQAKQWDVTGLGSYRTTKPLPLRTGGVIGAGTMGTGIALTMLNAGMSVVLVEQSAKFLDQGIDMLKKLFANSVRLKYLSAEEAEARMERLKPTLHHEDLSDVDIVVEAIYENMEIKKEMFRKLDVICKPGALLCTNTSSLCIDQIAEATKRPDKVIGTHFFVPAYSMKLLENVRGAKTSAETIATAQMFGTKLGKVPVLVGNCVGFAANRMRTPLVLEALFMLEEGCTPREVDQVAEDFGFMLGPLKTSDLTGLDVFAAIRRERAKLQGFTQTLKGQRVSTIIEQLVEQGRLGRKNGKGFFHYDAPNGKEAFDDPYVVDFLNKYSQKSGRVRRNFSTQEIQERLLYSCINEGFKIMEDGICTRTEELDTIWLLGFAWPRYIGGPMFYADKVGLDKVYEKVCHYYDEHPTSFHWQPSKLLHLLAVNQVPFNDWNKYAKQLSSHL